MSEPRPPDRTSGPPPPCKKSRPGPPRNRSTPKWPNRRSLPEPPSSESSPVLPNSTSSPPRPRTTSSPPSAQITSSPAVPTSVSEAAEPTIVHAGSAAARETGNFARANFGSERNVPATTSGTATSHDASNTTTVGVPHDLHNHRCTRQIPNGRGPSDFSSSPTEPPVA